MPIKTRKFRGPSLAEAAPYLRYEYAEDNEVPFDRVSARSSKPCGWKCLKYGHRYSTRPSNRTLNGLGCPYCSGQRVSELNSLATKAPWLEEEYNTLKNVIPFAQLSYGSRIRVWWKCKALQHEWQERPKVRVLQKCGCPYCSGKRVSELNSLATKAPWLEGEYDSVKNTTPFAQVSYGSAKKVWWKCKALQHEWLETPRARVSSEYNCPYCSGKRVSKLNSLTTTTPWLEEEYHPTKNTVPFDQNSRGSDKERWWRCKPERHEWKSSVANRVAGNGCPSCASVHSKTELVVFNSIKEKYPDAVSGQRRLLKTKSFELDIYVPSLKKAIEYDGTYWHGRPGCAERDLRKTQQCSEAGIQLLRIPEAEYLADPSGTVEKALKWLDASTSDVVDLPPCPTTTHKISNTSATS